MILIMKNIQQRTRHGRHYSNLNRLRHFPLLWGLVGCGLAAAADIAPVDGGFAALDTAFHHWKQVIEAPFLALGDVLAPHAKWLWMGLGVIGLGRLIFHYSHFLRAVPPLAPAEPANRLPEDIPAAAWGLWLQGKTTESASLLYRGAVAYLCAIRRAPLSDSATEEECLRAAVGGLPLEAAAYFKELTLTWQQAAYGARLPLSADMRRLCEDWPRYFRVRR